MQILTSSTLGHFFVRPSRVLVCRASKQPENNERNNYNVRKGKQFENARRRRGRPAHLRSPYDSPLRDGNRDRLIGLLTERAAKTLMVYLMETNANVYSWLVEFYKSNPIPKNGSWDEVSGEAFLRKLLSMPIEEAKFNTGRDSLFDNVRSCGVDPRSIAQRIMDIRTQLSEEFIQELQAIAEENSVLLRETLQTSLSTSLPTLDDPAAAGKDGPVHPELAEPTASSSSSTAPGSTGSSKGGAATTPPPSPTPDAPKSKPEPTKASSSSSAKSKTDSDAADKAAAVAALNAALKAAPAAGSGAGSSKRPDAEAAGSSDNKVDMADVLAQLRRAMEADVARDVMKMKENITSSPAAAGPAAAAAGSDSSGVMDSTPGDSAAAAVAGTDTAASAEGGVPSSLEPTATPQEEDGSAPDVTVAAAADGIPDGAGADSSSDEDSADTVSTQLSSSAVGEAGTYSRMLPKGWGPRLGVGFSKYPRSRNNIVSSASLGVSMSSPVPTTGDAAGAANSSTEAV